MRSIKAADLFCGAGGTSTGLLQACEASGRKLELVAVNHWERAVETHAANHPAAQHHCQSLHDLDPVKAVPGRKLDLLVASPECTHHSVARGGKPMSDQSRSSAWCILRWCTALRVDRVLIENVPEFETWGPIGASGRPLASKRGETFRAFVQSLRSLGYAVSWRVLNAANYGAATSRRRLFIQAVRGRRAAAWPDTTHEQSPAADPGLFGSLPRWRGAREVIDWTFPSQSIFGRKRPLSENTLRRIEAGLQKFGGAAAEPFLVLLRGTDRAQVAGSARDLVEPFVVPFYANGQADSTGDPLRTVTTRDRFGLAEPRDGVKHDILFRMLQPHELAAAMGFPAGYKITGNRGEQVRQIGNAVEVNQSRALCSAMLGGDS